MYVIDLVCSDPDNNCTVHIAEKLCLTSIVITIMWLLCKVSIIEWAYLARHTGIKLAVNLTDTCTWNEARSNLNSHSEHTTHFILITWITLTWCLCFSFSIQYIIIINIAYNHLIALHCIAFEKKETSKNTTNNQINFYYYFTWSSCIMMSNSLSLPTNNVVSTGSSNVLYRLSRKYRGGIEKRVSRRPVPSFFSSVKDSIILLDWEQIFPISDNTCPTTLSASLALKLRRSSFVSVGMLHMPVWV